MHANSFRMIVPVLTLALVPAVASAEEPAAAPAPVPPPPLGTLGDGSPPKSLWDSLFKGKVSLDMRARYEHAEADGSRDSDAGTLRTRLGYGTAPYKGLSFFVEMEDIRAADDDSYDPNRIIEGSLPRTFISDPEDTELNQGYIKYDSDFRGFGFVLGRQRIILDDARFVGNVGWRQNEQTFDAFKVTSDFDTEDWMFTYAYLWDVNRIFGDLPQEGLSPTGSVTRDFESNSHLVNLSYDGLSVGKITGFAYLLDLERYGDEVEVFSSNTIGLRLDGSHDCNDDLTVGYILSYAHQTDAADNPADYDADYFLAEGSLTVKKAVKFTAGYELLGADGTTNGFRTPLATLHTYQGWSDVLSGPSLTGGAIGAGAGIEDIYLGVSPLMLPWGLNGQVIYHFFSTDSGGVDIGDELNIVLSKKINNNLMVMAKYAGYNADEFDVDTQRFWVEVDFKF